jgi:adenosylcobinamide-phosphate synthase
MRLEWQILAAVALDFAVGDPRWLPHPVRGIAWVAQRLESVTRRVMAAGHACAPAGLAQGNQDAGGRDARPTRGRDVRDTTDGGDTKDCQDAENHGRDGSTELTEIAHATHGQDARATAAGVVAALVTYCLAGFGVWGLMRLAGLVHPWLADLVGIIAIYTTVAARDLARHSMAVYRPLAAGDLPAARKSVGMIVGRDTDGLDEAGVARAAVESVAESTVDGVTAPLFYALVAGPVAGPVAAMVYRAVNTLDSMFGHKSQRYLHFGWAAARIDDVANYIPSRLTAPLIALAAAGRGGCRRSLRILARDGRKHESPNSGLAEAAMAGALGVELGGTNYYQGEALVKPTIGDGETPLRAGHIVRANGLMFASAAIFLAMGIGVRLGVERLWAMWRAGQ